VIFPWRDRLRMDAVSWAIIIAAFVAVGIINWLLKQRRSDDQK
jgi:hypothetical protein